MLKLKEPLRKIDREKNLFFIKIDKLEDPDKKYIWGNNLRC
jgi:hypothetical protein